MSIFRIDIQVVRRMRERTGRAMIYCKKALIEAKGNVEKAEEILKTYPLTDLSTKK